MSNTIDDAHYVLSMKTNARDETEKITKNIQALKDALKLLVMNRSLQMMKKLTLRLKIPQKCSYAKC